MYFVPGREVVAVGLARRFGVCWSVGLLVGWSVPGWVALFGGSKIDVFIK